MFETKQALDVQTEIRQDVSSTSGAGAPGLKGRTSSQAANTPRFDPPSQKLIPVMLRSAPEDVLVDQITPYQAALMLGVERVINKRGHITRVYVSEWYNGTVCKHGPGKFGQAFEQEIPSGRVYALRGVEGSK